MLCLGARLGGEVRAFKGLGMIALGIDLNPGRSNMDVVAGDFHDIPFPDGAFDFSYSNVLDHVFDTARFAREVCRVMKPGGTFFATLYPGDSQGGKDAWTARQANSLDNKDQFVAAMTRFGFEKTAETEIKEAMDLSSTSVPKPRGGRVDAAERWRRRRGDVATTRRRRGVASTPLRPSG